MHESIGGYTPSDIRIVAAFDIDSRKVGKRLSDAIFEAPNCCYRFAAEVDCDTIVKLAPLFDGVAPHMKEVADKSKTFTPHPDADKASRASVLAALVKSKAQVLVNYLPVGSQEATEFYAGLCLDAGIAFCNCIPVFIASNPVWASRFATAGLPVIGDDMRSQFGASVLSQVLMELAAHRGVTVKCHIQQNSGGNTDFLNMTAKDRVESKRISKENVLYAVADLEGRDRSSAGFVHAGPSDYISHFGDTKVATFHIEMENFGGCPLVLDARLSVEDSPNSAGVVIDAIRYLVVARELGVCGVRVIDSSHQMRSQIDYGTTCAASSSNLTPPFSTSYLQALRGPSAFTQKSPPEPLSFADAKMECDALADRRLSERLQKQVRSSPSQKAGSWGLG